MNKHNDPLRGRGQAAAGAQTKELKAEERGAVWQANRIGRYGILLIVESVPSRRTEWHRRRSAVPIASR